MNAADVMTHTPSTLLPSAPLSEAIRLMRAEHIRHLPVTDAGRVVGVLSDRDVRALALAAVLTDDAGASRARLAQPIGDIANRDVVTVAPDTELRVVVDLLLDRHIGAVPVVADGGRIVGLVSSDDVLRIVGEIDFFDLIAARRSVRAFAPYALAHAEVDAILGAAQRAPSAGNLQSWAAVVVEGEAALARVAAAALDQDFIARASLAVVFAADPVRAAGEYGARGANLYCVQDATIACAYAQLAATACGLANVWVGAFDEPALARAVALDADLQPVALLVIGRGAEPGAPTSRRPLASHVRRPSS